MGPKAAALVAEVIDRLEGRPPGTGRPPLPTLHVVETLRFFVREGVPSGAAMAAPVRRTGCSALPSMARAASHRQARLRCHLAPSPGRLECVALLRRVHVALLRIVRSGPEVAA